MDNKLQSFLVGNMPSESLSNSIAGFFSIFSDATRIKIISALSISDMCVGDLAQLLNVNQSTVSHQLRLLKDAGVVTFARDGKNMNYTIINPLIEDVMITGIDNLDYQRGNYNPLA